MKSTIIVILLVVSALLPGCAKQGATESLKPVCEALGPPHEYNPTNKNSSLYAGKTLATRLDRDNSVGENLPCPGY